MAQSKLFSPVTIPTRRGDGLTLRNRAVLAPMCQYAVEARDGIPHSWQLVHLGSMAHGGFSLLHTEATAVAAEGRISDKDVGIWNTEQEQAWAGIVDYVHGHGARISIQLAHAGAKASTYAWLPGEAGQGRSGSIPRSDGGWQTVTSSDSELYGLAPAESMTREQIQRSLRDWAAAAQRADQAGFDAIQIHGAHGYLIHQFLSPLSNRRTDEYGGSYENRTRYLKEALAAISEVWPAQKVLGIRLSGEDWVQGGWGIAETVRLAGELYDQGIRAFDLSSAGIGPFRGPSGPGYQIPLAAAVKQSLPADAFVTAVGGITQAVQAEQVLVTGQADGVSIGRAALGDPQWANRAAERLGAEKAYPPHYWRGRW
ncbi:tRNA-dihydrouridine synthase [Glutamicibacter sp. MNS18]|uniref:oxidoreductase n=1 Tax=Glutamicibacter sp. MNS18 TaxID=2989817 RepID=UPI002235EB5B|nr:tRNA-dihydrouridine synthase [Glutamicibacter sp. MNS18]MCW4463900.1 tRNA-dihydrouridine synthase [Glutamicibacter sp. MNS18]